MFLLHSSSPITSTSAFASSLDSLISSPTSTISLTCDKNQNYNQASHCKSIMTTSIGFHIFILYLFTTLPVLGYAKTTTNPATNHNTPPQLLCLDSGFCVPKTISTPSLDLESHLRLDITNQASLTPQLGGRMLDQNVVFAVRIAEGRVGDDVWAKRIWRHLLRCRPKDMEFLVFDTTSIFLESLYTFGGCPDLSSQPKVIVPFHHFSHSQRCSVIGLTWWHRYKWR